MSVEAISTGNAMNFSLDSGDISQTISLRRFLFYLMGASVVPGATLAQCSAGPGAPSASRVVRLRSAADDSARLGTLLGACWANGTLLRSAATLSLFPEPGGLSLVVVDPSVMTVWNSTVPLSLNDGSLWAGRGINATLSGGLAGSYRRLRFMLAPRIDFSQNEAFGILAPADPKRSGFASPWRYGLQSADQPLRFGSASFASIDAGDTMLESDAGGIALGVSSSEQWWGPGVRNALLLSNNAGGIPRVYARTPRPFSTPLGEIEGEWFLGQLIESPFFDRDSSNDVRSLSAAAVVLRPSADSGLRIGVARAVYASVSGTSALPGRIGDAFLKWHTLSDSTSPSFEQITSVFGRWAVPAAGLAAHAEWATIRFPRSLRDFMVEPGDGQAFTVGFDWATALTAISTLRVEVEISSLEQAPPAVGQETQGFYTSPIVPQGYTQRGQPIGASIGTGSSSQYLGATLFRRSWSIGGAIGRTRWDQDAYYRPPSQGRFDIMMPDISLFTTLSAGTDSRWAQVEVSWTRTVRWNYLFQSREPFRYLGDFDLRNHTLSLRMTPRITHGR